MINFPNHFLFSIFVCALKYVNMTRISNISFFRFCWENGKLDWPKCARTIQASFSLRFYFMFIEWTSGSWFEYSLMFSKATLKQRLLKEFLRIIFSRRFLLFKSSLKKQQKVIMSRFPTGIFWFVFNVLTSFLT